MAWDNTLKLTDVAIVFATLIGPILAIQAQKWLEASRAIKERQRWIFRTLMATRAERLSAQHVQALNAISIEFYGNSKQLKEINEKWKIYFSHFLVPTSTEGWQTKFNDLFINLLHEIAKYLGYEFSRVALEKEFYAPNAHNTQQTEQELIRKGLAELFSGKFSIPMDVKSVPVTPEATKQQDDLQKAILSWLSGKSAVPVTIKESEENPKKEPNK